MTAEKGGFKKSESAPEIANLIAPVHSTVSKQVSNPFWACLPEDAYIREDGFVANLNSKHPHDVIRADVVIARFEKSATQGCGLHYEIYESRLLNMAMEYLYQLDDRDRPVFWAAAKQRGLILTKEGEMQSQQACHALMVELRQDH